MSYLEELKPESPAVTSTRPDVQGVTIILPEGVPCFHAQILAELFRAANELISEADYTLDMRHLSDAPIGDPMAWRQRMVIFLGDIQSRWQTDRRLWQRAQQIMNLSHTSVLVGGAAFLLSGSAHEQDTVLAIHPNFTLAAGEEGLQTAAPTDLYLRAGRIQSAISALAVIKLLLDHIREMHGDFSASALAGYVGIDSGPEQARSPFALDIRRRSGGDRVVANCLDLMEQNLESPQSIHDIAHQLHVSPRQLQRRFMNVLKETPLAIYRVLRAEKAHELLTRTSLPLAEVALVTGFATPSHLTRCVKQVYSATPRDLRCRAFRLEQTRQVA